MANENSPAAEDGLLKKYMRLVFIAAGDDFVPFHPCDELTEEELRRLREISDEIYVETG